MIGRNRFQYGVVGVAFEVCGTSEELQKTYLARRDWKVPPERVIAP